MSAGTSQGLPDAGATVPAGLPSTAADDQRTVPEGASLQATLLQGFEHLPPIRDFAAGSQVGPYLLRRQLGAGGMGVVWLADQVESVQRPVALKLVQRQLRGSLAEAYFQVERQALAQMNHPAIARIFDAGTLADGAMFFAMEHIEGRTLDAAFASRSRRVGRSRPPPSSAKCCPASIRIAPATSTRP